MVDCVCQHYVWNGGSDELRAFRSLHASCPALNQLLIPSNDWNQFEQAALAPPDAAYHRSMLLLAFERGYLGRITLPIHRYLLDGKSVKSNVTNQYRIDLAERWMFENSVDLRHERSKSYLGRLGELILATSMEDDGWVIPSLEAWGGKFDIEASKAGLEYVIEVKHIGQESDGFYATVRSLNGGDGIFSISPYSSMNNLLFRVYEAACKISLAKKRRIVCIVISSASWESHFEIPMRENWIDWNNPNFFQQADDRWNQFRLEQEKRYPAMSQNLAGTLRELNEIWIFREKEPFQYVKCYAPVVRYHSDGTARF
jgi:hypothetical protein